MLTRRDKLLVRPWQLRRYNTHRKKVLSALPVIDFGPPPRRGHVTVKLKKLQLEDERQMKIEKDNFRLLQRMGAIMKKNRLDNYWEKKPPSFLRRVGIYHKTRTPSPAESETPEPADSNFRKSRCLACSGQLEKSESSLSEDRMPWEPPKKSPSARAESALPLADIKKKITTQKVLNGNVKEGIALPSINSTKSSKSLEKPYEKRIVFEQGPFQLALNYPIYVDVKVKPIKGD